MEQRIRRYRSRTIYNVRKLLLLLYAVYIAIIIIIIIIKTVPDWH